MSRDLIKTSLADPKGQVNSLLARIQKSGYQIENINTLEGEKGTLEEPREDYQLADYQ